MAQTGWEKTYSQITFRKYFLSRFSSGLFSARFLEEKWELDLLNHYIGRCFLKRLLAE